MASTSDVSEGPVFTVLTNRIRNLRKKLNRITQIENHEILLFKPSLHAVIEELEELRPPLTNAFEEELPKRIRKRIHYLRKKLKCNTENLNKIKQENKMLLLSKPSLQAVIEELEKLRLPLTNAVEEELPKRIRNRICNLRIKLNHITQIENSNQIKQEQLDLVLSKPSLYAVVEELEKLPLPLTSAVDEELTKRIRKRISKRIRNLRKKLNHITQIENSNQIKQEQLDLVLSKRSLYAVVEELEKLRLPLTNAVDEELKNTVSEKTDDVSKGFEKSGVDVSKTVGGDDVVEDLLKVIYFGRLFNVKMGRSEFDNIMLTRTHERNCCLTYDTVTDDDVAIILNESDLDLLSEMSELLVSRPVDSSFSHEVALMRCVEHAKKWVAGSQERIDENSNVTYAALREKLAKIVGSYYYKITPEKLAKITPADVAAEAAAESYHFVQAESEAEQKAKMSLSPARKHEFPLPSTNKEYYDRVTLIEELLDIFNPAIEQCFSELDDEFSDLSRLEGLAQKKYGDYVCMNIWTICEGLRKLDPFHQKQTQVIARKLLEAVKEENQKSKMIEKLCLRDVAFLTFRLSPKWMTERIKMMIKFGIDIWAPVLDEESMVINSPTPLVAVEAIRSHYIKEMLSCMLDYSGVSVSTCLVSDKSDESNDVVPEYFTKKREVITSISDNNHFFEDLQALWAAIYKKRGQLIVYVTSLRQREYVKQCIDVVTNELSCEWNPSVRFCGYRNSSVEEDFLSHFWKKYPSNSKVASLVALGKLAGYTPKAALECVIKYTYLKTHRLAECRFIINEMLDEEGNTFPYLLKTRVLISLLSENSGGRGMVKYTKAFFEKERELLLHLVQFTEVVEKACLTFLLHPVCIYLCDLCKKFTSYYYEVMEFLDLKTFKFKFFLCDATKLVMEKCFHLLGITPESSRRCLSSTLLMDLPALPRPVYDARPENVNPRLEMFCMNVVIKDGSFQGWKMHGIVSLVDADGLLSDERLPLNTNEHGHVVYFYREWYNPIGISKNSFVHFESPSPCHIAPFSTALQIYVKVFVTSADKCFQICNLEPPPIKLPEIWDDNKDYMRGTLSFDGNNGRIHIDYIALRDAVDVTMKLNLVSLNYPGLKAYVSGCIYAYYGDMLDGLDDLRQRCYKAIVFKADRSEFDAGPVPLKKSCMAVPFNGNLVLEACFYDSSERVIFSDKCIFPAQTQGRRLFKMALNQNCLLKLTLRWSQGPKSSYC